VDGWSPGIVFVFFCISCLRYVSVFYQINSFIFFEKDTALGKRLVSVVGSGFSFL